MYSLHPSLWSYSSLILSSSEESLARAYDWSVSEHVGICWILTLVLGVVYGSTLELYFKDSCWHFYRCNVFWNPVCSQNEELSKSLQQYCTTSTKKSLQESQSFFTPKLSWLLFSVSVFLLLSQATFHHHPPPPPSNYDRKFGSLKMIIVFFSFFLSLMGRRERAILKTSGLRNCRSCSLLKIPTDKVGGSVSLDACWWNEVLTLWKAFPVFTWAQIQMREWRVEPFLGLVVFDGFFFFWRGRGWVVYLLGFCSCA